MLIQDNKYYFNIDFEHIFNQKTIGDAPRFAIHDDMKYELDKLVYTFIIFILGSVGHV